MYDMAKNGKIIAVNATKEELYDILDCKHKIDIDKYTDCRLVYTGRNKNIYTFFRHDPSPLEGNFPKKYRDWFSKEWKAAVSIVKSVS